MAQPKVGSHIVLYDGVCALCDGLTLFLLQRDQDGKFMFASLQQQFSVSVLQEYRRDPANLDTLYVVANYSTTAQTLLSKSDAAFFILKDLGGVWALIAWLRILPHPLRDFGYDLVAKYRYRIFGKHQECALPKPQWKERFITD